MSIVGDIFGAFGAEDAEDKQFAASQAAQARINQGIKNFDPYMQNYSGAAGILGRLYGTNGQPADLSAFEASPGYQFRQQEDAKAIERSAAARGGLFSGATGKALQDRSQSLASQEFDNYVARLFGMSQMGQNAAGSVGNLLTGQAAIDQQIGDNQATSIMNQANAIGGIGDAIGGAALGGMYGIPGVAGAGTNRAVLMSLFG